MSRRGRLALGYLLVLLLLGAFAPFLANDAPFLVMSKDHTWCPIVAALAPNDIVWAGVVVLFCAAALVRRRTVLLTLAVAVVALCVWAAPRAVSRNLAVLDFEAMASAPDVTVIGAPHGNGPDTHRFTERRLARPFQYPGHPLGTDSLGRDVLARLIHGLRTSGEIAVVATLASTVLGTLLGLLAGWFSRRGDAPVMGLVQLLQCFPVLFTLLAFRSILAIGPAMAGIVFGTLRSPVTARLVRDGVRRLRGEPFVDAARVLRVRTKTLLVRTILPHVLSPVLVEAAFAFCMAIVVDATLSFVGLGYHARPSIGAMIQDGRAVFDQSETLLLFPSLLILSVVVATQWVAEGIRQKMDPRGEAEAALT